MTDIRQEADTYSKLLEQATVQRNLCAEIRQMLVGRLDLPAAVDWITDDQPLFGRGLELDSVDALEIVLGLSSAFGASVTDDDREAFGSVAKLAERISDQR